MGDQQSSPITRRTIAKGIAWSVPAFALATAAPALAQSPLVTFTPSGFVCKYPGRVNVPGGSFVHHAYLFPVSISNDANEPVTITAISASVDVSGEGVLTGDPEFWNGYPHEGGTPDADGVLHLAVNGGGTWIFVIDQTGNSAQHGGTVRLTVLVEGDVSERAYETTVEVNFATTPPCKDGDFEEEPETVEMQQESEESSLRKEGEPDSRDPESVEGPADAEGEAAGSGEREEAEQTATDEEPADS